MDNLNKFISKYKHFLLLLLFLPAQAWFMYDERTVRPRYIMFSRFDNYIPFVKEFIVPYLFWYIYMAMAIVYLGFVSKTDFYKLTAMLLVGMGTACIIYQIFPNCQNLRPVIRQNDIFSRIIKRIYSIDTNTNVAPSLHVYNSIAVHLSLISFAGLKKNKMVKSLSFICMVTICSSTMFVKQHSIKDVIWGTIMATVMYGIIYGLIPKFHAYREMEAKKADALS